ncbi:MAG: universal stress protein [Lysobacterales bacterium]|nr:MAG: universal stress protein [Xanthomonadales bacterium]
MFKNVLLAVDLNHDASWKKALPVAIANCKSTGARLHVVMVMPDFGMTIVATQFPKDFAKKLRDETERHLKEFVDKHVTPAIDAKYAVLAGGTVYELILRYAEQHSIDLIIMAAYRPDFKTFLLGPNAERVARHAKASVLVVRE